MSVSIVEVLLHMAVIRSVEKVLCRVDSAPTC